MHFAYAIPQFSKILFLVVSISLFFSPSMSDPRTSLADKSCGLLEPNRGPETFEFTSNFISVAEALSRQIAQKHWATSSIDAPNYKLVGFAQCHKDLPSTDCQLCYDEAREKLAFCLPKTSGRVYLDGCFARYDVYDFLEESVVKTYSVSTCGKQTDILSDKYIMREFTKKLTEAINTVTAMADVNKGFGSAEEKGGLVNAYALGQCWTRVDKASCQACLRNAGEKVTRCVPGGEGRHMNAGCYLRYSTQKFFEENALRKHEIESGHSKTLIIILIIALSLALLLLSVFGAFVGYKRYAKRKAERKKVARLPSAINKSGLHFKYEMLEQATECFSLSNKLGHGGNGSVFKGTLPDGKIIAVKRLFFTKRQWVDDFFNEVNLISGIRHKNLVRLLGCSIEGPESLLVYELVPNKNLNQILFDRSKNQTLSWQQRYDIILGIAEGLAYLHGGCGAKIIHRDIKNSNILLDENLTPKIADFGLARCVAPNKSHISTAIAGTLGYMAPEYLVRGQLTEKTDVYAFGVLAIEIACGRKNNIFVNDSGSVLQSVWDHYQSNNITESIVSNLKVDFQEKQASNALQVGLLCTQPSATLRPSMSSVFEMLSDKEVVVPSPKRPPFLNSSVLDSDDTAKSATSSLSLNQHSMSTVPLHGSDEKV